MAPRRAEGDRVKVLAMLSQGAPASLRRCSRVCLTLYVGVPEGLLVLQRRVVLQGNSWADFEAGNERVRVSHDERSVAEEEDLSVFSHNASL